MAKRTPQDEYLDAHTQKHGTKLDEKLTIPDTECRFYDTLMQEGEIVIHCIKHDDTAVIGVSEKFLKDKKVVK